MTVRVSPRAAMVFSRVGQPARTIDFSAQLLDSDGAPAVPPPPGMQWGVSEQSGLRLGETGVSGDSLTASADVHANRPGRDTLFVRSGSQTGLGVTTNWEWVSGSWRGPNWVIPGQSGCLELAGRDSNGEAVQPAGIRLHLSAVVRSGGPVRRLARPLHRQHLRKVVRHRALRRARASRGERLGHHGLQVPGRVRALPRPPAAPDRRAGGCQSGSSGSGNPIRYR